jgi:uncharacterized protein (TIGR00297 family)
METLQLTVALPSALAAAALVAALAYWRGALSGSGALGATGIGTLTFGLGGLDWGLILLLFFVSSTLWSHFREDQKRLAAERFAKGHRRDLGQVLANGGIPAALAIGQTLVPWSGWAVAFVGALASVNADTWATELGTLSRTPPRLITTGRRVAAGTSGAVSPWGLGAAALGAVSIGLAGGLLLDPLTGWSGSLIGAVAGLGGAIADSLLGATVQRIYLCAACGVETEAPQHRCGARTRPVRGWPGMDNDRVNLVASIIGAALALALWRAMS